MTHTALRDRQHDLVDEAHLVAQKALAPRATEHDRNATFPADNLADLHDAGLMGLLAPREVGGRGADLPAYVAVVAELARACGSTALIFAMHCGASRLLAADESPATRDALARIVRDRQVIAWGFSEPGTGGNILAPQLTASPEGDGVRVRGRKVFCTGAGHVDHYLFNATSGEQEFRRAQTMLLVPSGTPGLGVEPTWDGMGMRANQANDVAVDALVTPAHVIGGLGGGMPLLAHALPALVLGLAATSLGIAQAAHEYAIAHVQHRVHANTGHNLAGYQGVRMLIADATAAVHTASLTVQHAARVAETDPLDALDAMNLAKYVANRAAITVADICMEVCGGKGFLRTSPLERHFRDARAGSLMGANLGALRDMIAKSALGMDPRTD